MSISDFYKSNEYTKINSSLGMEDSPWKWQKIQSVIGKEIVPTTICDLCCGAGLITKYLIEAYPDAKVFGVDISSKMIDSAKKNCPQASFFNASVEDLPRIGLGQMDLVLLMDALEHLENPASVLKVLSRLTKYLVIKVPLEDSLWYQVNDWTGRYTKEDRRRQLGHIHYFNLDSIVGLLRSCNFETVAYEIISQNIDNPANPHISRLGRIINPLRILVFNISKRLFARIFNGSVIILAETLTV
jgi:ubiquinone/menaquinone biosynthesis C-methylase UbiE